MDYLCLHHCCYWSSNNPYNLGIRLTVFALGILLGATTPILTALISSATSSEYQGYVLGLSQSINQFASIGGIALGSIFILFPGIDWLFYYVSISYIASLIAIILLIKHSHK
ncbi:MFS transporter [Providencia manganoxydans]